MGVAVGATAGAAAGLYFLAPAALGAAGLEFASGSFAWAAGAGGAIPAGKAAGYVIIGAAGLPGAAGAGAGGLIGGGIDWLTGFSNEKFSKTKEIIEQLETAGREAKELSDELRKLKQKLERSARLHHKKDKNYNELLDQYRQSEASSEKLKKELDFWKRKAESGTKECKDLKDELKALKAKKSQWKKVVQQLLDKLHKAKEDKLELIQQLYPLLIEAQQKLGEVVNHNQRSTSHVREAQTAYQRWLEARNSDGGAPQALTPPPPGWVPSQQARENNPEQERFNELITQLNDALARGSADAEQQANSILITIGPLLAVVESALAELDDSPNERSGRGAQNAQQGEANDPRLFRRSQPQGRQQDHGTRANARHDAAAGGPR